jgi:hypothetical protein
MGNWKMVASNVSYQTLDVIRVEAYICWYASLHGLGGQEIFQIQSVLANQPIILQVQVQNSLSLAVLLK